VHHRGALVAVEIGELARRAERGQAVDAGFDQVVAEAAEHVGADAAVGIDGGNEVGKDAVEVGHGWDQA
jgi:hypothetical protein